MIIYKTCFTKEEYNKYYEDIIMNSLREQIKPENKRPYEYKEIPLIFIKEVLNGWNNFIKINRKIKQ